MATIQPHLQAMPMPSRQTMPSPQADEDLSQELVDTMQSLFGGKHPGFRTTHAKGMLVEGTFTPAPDAKNLTTAAHFHQTSTPIIARFSVGGGLPKVPDASDIATPKGIAIRFLIDRNTHTDLIAHSFNGFATRNGEDFLTFLRLIKAGKKPGDKEMDAFLENRPEAKTFLLAEKPNPHNYGTIIYYQPNTHVLKNKAGEITNVRYRLMPADGEHLYSKSELPSLGANYLEDDLLERFPAKPVVLQLVAHIAGPDDCLDDATIPYKSTTFVPVGKIELNKVTENNVAEQKEIAFSPSPEKGGVTGIKNSNDPLIQDRKGVYWVSADQRRHERQVESTGVNMP